MGTGVRRGGRGKWLDSPENLQKTDLNPLICRINNTNNNSKTRLTMSDCKQEFSDGCKQLLPMIAILEEVTAPLKTLTQEELVKIADNKDSQVYLSPSTAPKPAELSLFNDLLQSMIDTATKLSPQEQAYKRDLAVRRWIQDTYADARDPAIYSGPIDLFKVQRGKKALKTIKERLLIIQEKCSKTVRTSDTINDLIDLVNSLEKHIPHVNGLFE